MRTAYPSRSPAGALPAHARTKTSASTAAAPSKPSTKSSGLPCLASPDQYQAGPQLPAGAPLELGDLVFFGWVPDDVTHVGIQVCTEGDQTAMVNAPYNGVDV